MWAGYWCCLTIAALCQRFPPAPLKFFQLHHHACSVSSAKRQPSRVCVCTTRRTLYTATRIPRPASQGHHLSHFEGLNLTVMRCWRHSNSAVQSHSMLLCFCSARRWTYLLSEVIPGSGVGVSAQNLCLHHSQFNCFLLLAGHISLFFVFLFFKETEPDLSCVLSLPLSWLGMVISD